MTYEEFLDGAKKVAQTFDEWVKIVNPPATADHICFKCGDSDEFERMRALFEVHNSFMYQSWISGRRIAIIKLPDPVDTALLPIKYLELSDQKSDGSQVSGFDHIEIVPDGDVNYESIEKFVEMLNSGGETFLKSERPHHTTYDTTLSSGLKIRIEPEDLIEKIARDEMGIIRL